MNTADAESYVRPTMHCRFRGAFLGCLLGDAAGRPFEMMSASDGRLGPALDAMLARSGVWAYTDDTEMMISVAESLTRLGSVSPEDILATLAANYDAARGYGHGMKRAVEAFRSGRGAAFSSWAEGSKGNGGAVRIVPIACAYHSNFFLNPAGGSAYATGYNPASAERLYSMTLTSTVVGESPLAASLTLAKY